jgi:leucyl aminopeptidase
MVVGTQGEAAATLVLAHDGRQGAEVLADDAAQGRRVREAMDAIGWDAERSEWLDLLPQAGAPRLLLVAMPKAEADAPPRWRLAGRRLQRAMAALRLPTLRLPTSSALGEDGQSALRSLLQGAVEHSFEHATSRQANQEAFRPGRLVVHADDAALAAGVLSTQVPVQRARAWVERPANELTPAVFASEAQASLGAQGVQVSVLGFDELQALGAHALLAVARGSANPPRLVVAEWRGAPEREGWDAAWVGKGLTFDGGGLNLKTAPVIEKMKFDMAGAAAALCALEAAAARRARANVVAVVPMAENVIGPDAFRPGDVIGSLAGLSIEVVNTDAEGRVVLADAITHALRVYAPRCVIDIATLTGMVTGVLHEEFAALYCNDDALARSLQAAGEQVDEALWRLPLSARQDYLVDSRVADVSNLGAPGFLGLGKGSPTAGAKFIERFVRGTPWAHLDIAGTAWSTRPGVAAVPGATGFGVALLDAWLQLFAEAC